MIAGDRRAAVAMAVAGSVLRAGSVTAAVPERPPAVEVHVTPGVERSAPPGAPVEPGVSALLRAARVARVELGVYLPVPTPDKLTVGVRAPASVTVQLGEGVHLAVSSGATIGDLRKPARTTAVPIGLSAGWRAPLGRGGTVGLTPSVTWPHALDPGLGDPAQRGAVVVLLTLSVGTPF
jgi:hypothetical protein